VEKKRIGVTPAPYLSVPFPQWGQGKFLCPSNILLHLGEGCPKDRKESCRKKRDLCKKLGFKRKILSINNNLFYNF
jgi:hypothetical protein